MWSNVLWPQMLNVSTIKVILWYHFPLFIDCFSLQVISLVRRTDVWNTTTQHTSSLQVVWHVQMCLTSFCAVVHCGEKRGEMCLLCHIVRWRVNRICVDFLLIVLTWGLGSVPWTAAAQMERPVLLHQPEKQRQLLRIGSNQKATTQSVKTVISDILAI